MNPASSNDDAFFTECSQIEECEKPMQKLKLVRKWVTESSLKKRTWVWGSVMLKLLSELPPSNPKCVSKVVNMMWSTVQIYHDRKSKTVVENFLASALKTLDDELFTVFLDVLFERLTLSVSSKPNWMVQISVVLFRWSCCVILDQRAMEQITEKPKFTRFMKGVFSTLHHIHVDARKNLFHNCLHQFVNVILSVKQMFTLISGIIGDKPSVSDCPAIGALIQVAQKSEKTVQEYQEQFIEYYISIIFSGDERPYSGAHSLFLPFISTLNDSDFNGKLFPIIERSLKRSPEKVIDEFSFLLSNITFEKNFIDIKAICSVTTGLLSSRNEKIRDGAVSVLVQLTDGLTHPETFELVLSEIATLLSDKDPKIRFYAIQILGKIAANKDVLDKEVRVKLSETLALGSFVPAMASEVIGENRTTGMRALASWLKDVSTFSKEIRQCYIKGFKEGNAEIRQAYLQSINIALYESGDPTFISGAAPFVGNVISKVKNTIQNIKMHTELVYYFSMLAIFSANDSAVNDNLIKDNIWNLLLSAEFFYEHSFVSELSENEKMIYSMLCDTMITHHYPLLVSQTKPGENNLFSIVIYLLLSKSWEVRKAIRGVVSKTKQFNDSLSDDLISAFYLLITSVKERRAFENQRKQQCSSVLSNAMTSCLPTASEEALSKMTLITHHPFILTSKQLHLFKKCCHICSVDHPPLDLTIGFLLGTEGVFNTNHLAQSAAHAALCSLVKIKPTCIEMILEKLWEMTESASLLKYLTEEHVKIFRTAEGELWLKDGEELVSEVIVEQKGKKLKGQKMYEELEEEKRTKVVKKQLTPENKELQDKKLEKQHNIRQKISEMLHVILTALQTLQNLCEHAPFELFPYVGDILNKCQFALPSPLSEISQAYDRVIKALARVLNSQGNAPPLLLCDRLGEGIVKILEASYDELDNGFNANTVRVLRGAFDQIGDVCGISAILDDGASLSSGHPFPLATLTFCLPLVEAILIDSRVDPDLKNSDPQFPFHIQEIAFVFLKLHALLKERPKKPYSNIYFKILFYMMENFARYKKQASTSILQLAEGLPASEISGLLIGLLSTDANVRETALKALMKVPSIEDNNDEVKTPKLIGSLWVAMHDSVENNGDLAEDLWDDLELDFTDEEDIWNILFDYVYERSEEIRKQAGRAIAAAVEEGKKRNFCCPFSPL